MKFELKSSLIIPGIILYGLVFLVPFIGQVHLFDWDEINFAESAREMLVSRDFITVQINFEPFWEKPPFFIWLQVVSMKIFGINEFASRFPNAVCGIISLIALYFIGKRLYNEKFGFYWMLAYAGSVLPFFYFKSGIIDPWFNLFIFAGIVFFIFYLKEKLFRRKYLVISAFFLGIAVLTKGPVAILIFILTFGLFQVFRRFRIHTSFKDVLFFILVFAFTGGFWFILQIMNGNSHLIRDFINYQVRLLSTQDAGHGGFFMYHFIILFFGVFPASLLALLSFKDHFDGPGIRKDFFLWMMIIFWVVLILFSIVNTKIIHYSSLCYFPLTYFAALTIRKYENSEIRIPLWLKYLIGLIGITYGVSLILLTRIDKFKDSFIERLALNDPFGAGNLSADVEWSGYEFLIGLLFIFALIFSLYLINRSRKWGLRILFFSTSMFIYFSILFIVPRVEQYTQRAAIDFYRKISSEDAYIATLGFKSYAHLFYGNVQPEKGLVSKNSKWLLEGDIDKNAYFVFKIHKKERYIKEYPELEILYDKNGFVFAKRSKP